ncbi:ATP-grasp domain-containing protein [Thermomicrobium sp. 4228-Ro]|uniref:ATP-grasp domain-containing protein n=1 Tax=Thermomicrobium sp. 4228-Ro TaxID=2993937 RepID=UPI003A4C6ACE
MKTVALLAERLRVEERLLQQAFAAVGWEAQLCDPNDLAIPLQETAEPLPSVSLDRERATSESTALAALLAARGGTVVNRPATTRLLADRLAFLRHLIVAGIPTPPTVVAFGEAATLRAIASLGYPVYLKSLVVDPTMPVAYVEDPDAAEALVEHRRVLGDERAVLVQKAVAEPEALRRLVVVGTELLAVIRGRGGEQPLVLEDRDRWQTLAMALVSRLGSGVYAVDAVDTERGPIVVSAENLVHFRELAEHGLPVAERIAAFVIEQVHEEQAERGGTA